MTRNRILPVVLIITGAIILLFPTAREYYYNWQEGRLLSELEHAPDLKPAGAANSPIQAEYEKLSQLLTQTANNPEPQPAPETVKKPAQDLDDNAIGLIEIDKIDLKLPILEGASQANLRYAAAHMTETNPIGQTGNAAIAAHRARTKGRLFNRLNELEIGDKITIQTNDKQLTYNVNKISIVEPTDLSVLASSDKESIVTLITCEPLKNPTHRLIVQASLES
ncbi:class D sortase [Paenibacillus spongiae]|uniref:Class D sortase n=1 Tax=Paenibacillus spongiae TaxID=2909671 RepID=A0ABY5S361_9BACL|nr:class D sortase [Paenibacillus spongiae]UVI28351.1 class D sortase [Paenibacillus spongiae]